jgi:hypothetical protein
MILIVFIWAVVGWSDMADPFELDKLVVYNNKKKKRKGVKKDGRGRK